MKGFTRITCSEYHMLLKHCGPKIKDVAFVRFNSRRCSYFCKNVYLDVLELLHDQAD